MSSKIIEIEKIEEYSWKKLMDMDIYDFKKFTYSGGNVLRYLLSKDREAISNLKYVKDNQFDLRLAFNRFTFRFTFDLTKDILAVECIVPCPDCQSGDTHVYLDDEDWKNKDGSDQIECLCLSCGKKFKI